MPPYVKNTGMSSLNELFAMKKNLAYETKFEHQLSGMRRDYYNKRENLKQDIRTVYSELKNIKVSTGHSLDQAKSTRNDNRKIRRTENPTIYLPPIGIRLMKKYVGIDVRRQSLISDASPAGQQLNLESILNRTIGVTDTSADISKPLDQPETRKNEYLEAVESQNEIPAEKLTVDEDKPSVMIMTETMPNPTTENHKVSPPFVLTREQPIDETILFKASASIEANTEEICNIEEELSELKREDSKEGTLFVETECKLSERRSSRSTFRGRSSARLPSLSNELAEYNLGVVALSQKKSNKSTERPSQAKEKIRTFYLDYGDGKLHDSMEIPKMKDCSRPWCNPHCKTCRNRTTSRPCFILIPAEENVRKRKLPLDKRRRSTFPVYLTATRNKADDTGGNTQNTQALTKETTKISEEECVEEVDNTVNTDPAVNVTENEEENDDVKDENIERTDPNIEQILQQRVIKRKTGYSKKRMEELSQPRGGPTAEVRFSKMSLRKKQDELIADERSKALTEFERDNLSNIQGKISMFLALLNEKEIMGKPVKMVDIPMRMDVDKQDTSKSKKTDKKPHRNVHFDPRDRLLS